MGFRLQSRGRAIRAVSTAVLIASFFAAAACSRQPPAGTVGGAAVSVSVQAARIDAIRDTISAPGTVVPSLAADWTIYAPEPGRIAELPKAEGDTVQVGDLLVRFDLAGVARDIADRQADVARLAHLLDTANAELANQSSLYDRGLTPRNVFEAAKTAQGAAESSLAAAKAVLAATTTLSEQAAVRARFAGVIAKRWHSEGDFVDAATKDPVLRVIDPTRVQVAVPVSGAELLRIMPGQQATIAAVGGGAAEMAAVVMRPTALDPGATTADLRLSFSGPTTMVADTPVHVEILLDQRANAVVVPAGSVARVNGQTYVMIAGADGLAHRRDVRVGLITAAVAEIVSGVTPGDRVIVRGLNDVSDGGPIAIDR